MYLDIRRLFYMKVIGQLYNAAALAPHPHWIQDWKFTYIKINAFVRIQTAVFHFAFSELWWIMLTRCLYVTQRNKIN